MAQGTKVAELYAEMGIDSSKLQKGLKDGEGKLKKFGSSLNDTVQSLTGFNVASLAGVGGLVMLSKFMGDSIREAIQAEKAQAQLNATLKSTGGAAGLSADMINDMATAMGRLNAIDNDEIVSASNVLLTFTQIGKNVFPTAMQAALDLSQAMGQDLQSSIVQVGKALNDPIAGMTALQRVGVTFSTAQKDQIEGFIKTNNLMAAQKIILDELAKEFGGSAAAAADTYEGKVKKLDLAWKNFQETVGTAVIPTMGNLLDYINWQIDRTTILNKIAFETGTSHIYLSEAEKDAAIAAYEYGQKIWTATGEVRDYNFSIGEMTQAHSDSLSMSQQVYQLTQDIAVGAVGATEENMKYVGAIQQLGDATQRLKDAQEGWMKGAGGDVKTQLEQAGLKGEAYTKALAAIDTQMGTNYVQEKAYNDNVKSIVEQYAKGGTDALPKFTAGLATLKTSWMEQAEGVQAVRTEVINLQSSLDLLVSKSYHVGVTMTTGSSGASGVTPSRRMGGAQENANGGSWIIPARYGNEGYQFSDGRTASAGERVTITPASQVRNYNFNYTGNATQQQITQSYEMARLLG